MHSKNVVAKMLAVLAALPTLANAAGADVGEGPWWLGHAVTAAGFVLTAASIVYQLGRQHQNEIRRQNENFKSQLKLQVYQEFSTCLSVADDKLGKAISYATTAAVHAKIYMQQVKQGINPSPVEDRAMTFLDKHSSALDATTEVVFLIEKYMIMHLDLDIFRTALASASHDARQAFQELFELMLTHLPVDELSTQGLCVVNVRQFSAEELEKFQTLAAAYFEAAGEIGCYLSDMRIELQTLLLKDLFPSQLPKRKPIDPSKKVINLDSATIQSLRTHFDQHTEWGKNSSHIQREVRSELFGHGQHG